MIKSFPFRKLLQEIELERSNQKAVEDVSDEHIPIYKLDEGTPSFDLCNQEIALEIVVDSTVYCGP
jgi:hypothetical protein